MGKDSGITVIDEWAKGHTSWKQWTFRVRDPRRRSYISKAFEAGEKSKGYEWADAEKAKLTLGLTSSGAVPFAAVAQRYVDDITAIGRKPSYIAEVQRLAAAVVAAGAVNLRDDGFALAVRDWLVSAPCFFKVPDPAKAKPESHRPVLANLEARLVRAEQLLTTCTAKERPNYERRLEHWRARVARARGRAEAKRREPAGVTKNRWLVILKSIGKCAVKHYGLASNPLSAIRPFKVDRNIKTALRVDELRAMVADAKAADWYHRQACLIVYSGMRVDEAAHVRWDWIDREARIIRIPASIRDAQGKVIWENKGNKARIAPLLDELDDLVGQWHAVAVAADGAARGWVIGAERLRTLEDKGHWETFREYLGRCGIDAEARDLSPHCTRHTWTAIMLATGASPNRVRRWLGHAKLETTDLYADAEASFERVVKEWPRAEMRLRARAMASQAKPSGYLLDLTGDVGGFLRDHLLRGTLDQLAATAGVPAATLRAWFVDGIPEPVRQFVAALAANAAMTAGAAAPSPLALIAGGAPAIAAPATSDPGSR